MGKLRLKLQAMMPSVWYRRLKMELGMRVGAGTHPAAINYKRWSSQRKQMGSSKKLLKASPLISSTTAPSLEEKSSHTKPPPLEERLQYPSQACSATAVPLMLAEGETHFAASNSATAIAHIKVTPSHAAAAKQCIQEREAPSLQECGDAPCNTQFPQQAPSLSSPIPLSDKSFQLDVQELSSKLNALNAQDRRTYYSSPIFAAVMPTPVLEKLDLDFMVNALTESKNENFVARKLFPEEGKLYSNEASRSSYGSTSFTGQSITSSEDTACDKASSGSIWEKDFSSLASEGSELFPAMEKIRNTVAFLRRKSRKARNKEASSKQRRRQKDLRGKPLQEMDEVGLYLHDGGTHCKDILGECKPGEEVSSIQKLKMALAGSRAHVLRSAFVHEAKSMQAQCEYTVNPKVQDGEDFVRHRRSVSNESLLLESMGVRPAFNRLSPWHYTEGNGKFSPNQCSDSAFSDSELEGCRNHRRIGMPQSFNSTGEHRRPPPEEAVYSDQHSINASPVYNESYPQVPFPARRDCPSNLHHPPFSKSKSMSRSFHPNVYDGNKNVWSPCKASLDAKPCHFSPYQSRGRYRWGAPSDSPNQVNFMLSKNTKSIDSPSSSSSTRRALNSCLHDNPHRCCLESKNTSGVSPESSSRLKVLNNTSNMLSDGDDYDGDVSLRSFSERPLANSVCKIGNRAEQQDGKVCGNGAAICSNSCAFSPDMFVHEGQVWPVQKNVRERTVSGGFQSGESLHGLISVPSWSKIYSKLGERDTKHYGNSVSFSRSPISLASTLMKDDASKNDCKLPINASTHLRYGEQDGGVAGARSRRLTSMRRAADGRECNDRTAVMEREVMSGGATMSKSHSRREELDGMECRGVSKQVEDDDEDEDSKNGRLEREGNERGVLRSTGFMGAGGLKSGAANAASCLEKEMDNMEKSKVYESFAMVKCSNNPSQDFKESMMEMVLHKKLHESLDLVELLQCYLSLNSPCYHDIIVKAFIELWSDLFHPSI